ncbi:MAG: pyruvate kinase [Planctomycetaceae bacterium]|jgi:pyruvate kinase|nr:pyruvate kinase [Planctomycetaceae bacterium]
MTDIVFPHQRSSHTKIVATVGPASDPEEVLAQLIQAGVDVFRLNMAHGGPQQAQARLDRIRKVSEQLGVTVGVLADLAGPKMRLGEIPGGEYKCIPGTPMTFVRGNTASEPNTFTTTYEPLIEDVKTGDRIMLADGTVALQVAEKKKDSIVCSVVQGGTVRSRQGINLPGTKLSIKTLQAADIENAKWATKAGVDFLGLSFVRSVSDIRELREILIETAREETGKWGDIPHIIAKIEKPEAVEAIDDIVQISDGIMVARGDLGVEFDIAQIAVVQKKIIETCRKYSKPVIVATQMLESMHHQTLPTRAEATDVANAVLDGTDACMLSGETAVGEYPVLTVQTMHRIALEAEKLLKARQDIAGRRLMKSTSVTHAVCDAAVTVAEEIDVPMILVGTRSGRTALALSNQRCFTMCAAASSNERALQRMNLYWGVFPMRNVPENPPKKGLDAVVQAGKKAGYLTHGDRVIHIVGITPDSNHQNVLYVHIVE